MKKHYYSFSLLFILLTIITITQQYTLKTLNKQCLCDITDQCDSQCCCDTSCDSTLITQWETYKLCLDDSFGIPFCSKLQLSDTNILDLHSGLRTIYSVIKRLLCITSVNFVQPSDWYKSTIADSDLSAQQSNIASAQSQSVLSSQLLGETQFAISGLPLKSSNGLCRSSSQITKNNQKSSSCRVYVTDYTALQSNQFLSISVFKSSLSSVLPNSGNIQIYETKQASTGSIAAQSNTTTTTCSSSVNCVNVIRQVKLFINSNDGSIDLSSYIVISPIKIDQVGYINIDYQYSFISANNNIVAFPSSSKIGYDFGTKINLVYFDSSSQYYKIFSPINLAFRKSDGSCRTSATDQSANSFVHINFGQNQIISCSGTINLIYSNIKTAFNYVGIYGYSSTKLSQFINVTFPSTQILNSQSVQLIFYYVNIGVPQNPQYQISKVQLKPVTIKDGLSTLYVQFINIGNNYDLYVPPAPIVDAYLPNDFLYPFFVA